MIYAQVCNPGSKITACEKVLPNLYNVTNFSYDQILDYVNYIGQDYEKYIEIFNHQIEEVFGKRKMNTAYFDCTNYYFEVDLPFQDKQKGPSKENRKSPIIGQALLLDEDQIPIAMKMYPGNKSEKPYLRQTIEDIKERYNINSKIVQVADKGLNCARNIYAAVKEANDGYIFSKAIRGKSLSKIEKLWLLLDDQQQNKWTIYYEDDGKTISHKMKECTDIFKYSFENENGDIVSFNVQEKRVVVYNEKLAKKQRAEIMKEVDNLKSKLTAKAISREELGDAVKYVKIKSETTNGEKAKTVIEINNERIEEELRYAGYNLIVTSEINKTAKEIYEAYHGLWRIEESFRILKTYLESRPVFLQLKESIYGHFLICYLSLVILRLLELKIFNDELPVGKIVKFIRDYKVTQTLENSFINNATTSSTYSIIKTKLGLSKLGNAFLNKRDIDCLLDLHLEDILNTPN